MIEFFEFLNTCSPLRATSYMVFILVVIFLSYTLIESLLNTLLGKGKKDKDTEDTKGADNYYSGAVEDDDYVR